MEDLLDQIIAGAFMEFRSEPQLAAQFASLVPGKGKPAEAPAPPPAG